MDATVLLAVFLVVAALYWILSDKRRRRLPPGPYGLPIVGYLPFMTDKPHLKLIELKKKYGPVYSIRMGCRYVLVLCDYNSIKEAFATTAFMGRPPDSPFEFSEETERLNVFSGMGWKEHRRFSLHMFRDLGFGNVKMEPHIKDEIAELLGRLEKEVGKPINASNLLASSTSNNISSLVFGKRRNFDDPMRITLDNLVREFARLNAQIAWHPFFPWIKTLTKALRLGRYKSLSIVLEKIYGYIKQEIEEHKKTLDPNHIRDFIDGYLLEIERRKNDPNTTFLEPVMRDITRAFFGAGSETVRTTMDWLLLVMASKPAVQAKVQSEIDEVIGKERFPSYEDHRKMPYTQAVITEVMRWRTIVPINVLRYTLEDTELNSYFIPKGSYVIANIWAVHNDPTIWGEDVASFKPERFLSEDGKEFKRIEHFIPFSIGKRACPGKSLADTETFLYFTSILQKFKVHLPSGVVPEFEGSLGIALQPQPYQIIFKIR